MPVETSSPSSSRSPSTKAQQVASADPFFLRFQEFLPFFFFDEIGGTAAREVEEHSKEVRCPGRKEKFAY